SDVCSSDLILLRSRSAECRISSSAGSCAQISELRREVLSCPDPQEPSGLLFYRRYPQTVSPLSVLPFRLQTVQTAYHSGVPPWHRLHRMPVQCERLRFRLSV